MEVGQNIEVKIESIDPVEKRISLVPVDYVSAENKDEEERTEYKAFITESKKKKSAGEVGSLGALLQARMTEKKK